MRFQFRLPSLLGVVLACGTLTHLTLTPEFHFVRGGGSVIQESLIIEARGWPFRTWEAVYRTNIIWSEDLNSKGSFGSLPAQADFMYGGWEYLYAFFDGIIALFLITLVYIFMSWIFSPRHAACKGEGEIKSTFRAKDSSS